MHYELKDITPQPSEIEIAGKKYQMRVFTLDDAIYFDEKYGSAVFYTRMRTRATAMYAEIAYRLITPCEWPTFADFAKSMTPQAAAQADLINKTMAAAGQKLEAVADDADSIAAEPANGGQGDKPATFQKTDILGAVILFIKSLLRLKR